MKNILFIGFFFLMGTFKAQGNLQFNQVKLVNTTEAVPAGKTWKVVGFLPSPNGNYQSITQPAAAEYLISVNGSSVNLGRRAHLNNNFNIHQNEVRQTEEFWVPAGTSISVIQNIVYLSVIEFNIVP
jgi:hypothetical protein